MANYTDCSFIHTTDYIIMEKCRSGEWMPEPSTGQIFSRKTMAHLKPVLIKGYLKITTAYNNRRVTIGVARAIWVAANGIPLDAGLEIDHINRIRTDNRLENLRLVSSAENKRNSTAASVMLQAAEEIRREFAAGGVTQKEMAHKYHCSRSTISRILKYETYIPKDCTAAAGGE